MQTNAAALSVPVNQLTDEERANLARELGYKSIGRELPDNVSLTDIIKSMPAEVRTRAQYRTSRCPLWLMLFVSRLRRCSSWTTARLGARA